MQKPINVAVHRMKYFLNNKGHVKPPYPPPPTPPV